MLRKLIRVWIIGIVFPLYAIAGQPSVKITHGPYLQNLSENEVTVVWKPISLVNRGWNSAKRKPVRASTPNCREKPMPHKTGCVASTHCIA